jgi:hypothetical protein
MNKVAKIAKSDLLKKTVFDLVTKVAKSFNLVKNGSFDQAKFDLPEQSMYQFIK